MHFLNPIMLWALAVIPPLGAIMVAIAWRRKKQLDRHFGEEPLVSRYSQPVRKENYQFKGLWLLLGLAALVVAIARPSIENGTTEFPVGTVDVIAVVDVSRSMAATDYKGKVKGHYYENGTRLDMARYLIVNDVVPALKMNRLGVVSYAGEAFPQAFLSDDLPALGWVLKRALTVSSAPGEGSAMAHAFDMAFQLYDLDSDPQHRKVIVLFSDGGNDDGPEGIRAMVAECSKRNIEVIVVGLGSTTPTAIPVYALSETDQNMMRGKQWYELDGEVVKTSLDENTLRYFANSTGGRYVRVREVSDFHIGSLVGRVAVKQIKGEQELFVYPLIAALLLLGLALVTPMEPRSSETTPKPQARKPRPRSRS
jgi:Ca-activated chloride channel homolog